MDADPHQLQWGDVGDDSTRWAEFNTTLMHKYQGYNFETPPVLAPSILTTVTPVTTTGGPKPRRTLTDDDRRRICDYHESHPGATQAGTGAVFTVDRSTVAKILRQKEKFSNNGIRSPAKKAKSRFPVIKRALARADGAKNEQIKSESPKSENTSPVSSVGSPTQDDARRALDLVWSFFQNQPAGILEPDEYATIGKLMVKLKLSYSPDGTSVLLGSIYPVGRSLSESVKEEND